MAKRKKDDESALVTFYYNHKILIWILIIILFIILVLGLISRNKEGIVPTEYDINLKIDDKDTRYVGIGNSINIKASINVEDAVIIWTSGDPNIAKVNNGTVTGVNYGKTTIMVSYIDEYGNKYLDSCYVEVVEGDENVSLTNVSFPQGDVYMPVNKEYRLNLVLTPASALINDKKFVSNNESIVTVTPDGVIKSHKEGKARIVAVVNGRFQTSIDVYVNNKYNKSELAITPTSLSFDNDTRKIKVGSSEKLPLSVTPSNADRTRLTWESDDPAIVKVDSNGVIKGISEGQTIVGVVDVNGQRADIIVEVYNDIIPVTNIIIENSVINMDAGKTTVISPVVTPSNASNKGLSYSSVDPSIVSVSVSGLGEKATLSALKKGTTEVIIRSGKIEKRITVNVTGDNNNSEIDENETTLPTTIKVRSNKNNLAKTYDEVLKIPVSGSSTITISLSIGVGKIKYCYAKYESGLCKPNIEKYSDSTLTIPSGAIYVLRIIKYDYKDNVITSTSPNYDDGVLNYYINTKSPSNTKLYTVTGAYDTATLATLSPSKIGDKVTIRVNDSNRYLKVCYATGKSCTPNTRVSSLYVVPINEAGTTRIYVNEYDENNAKVGNTEIYYVYVEDNNTNNNSNNNNNNNNNNTDTDNNTVENTVINDDKGRVEVDGLGVYNQTLIGKYLTATVTSDVDMNETRFCYKVVNKGVTDTCSLDLKSTTVPAHNGMSYFHPTQELKTYYATFSSTKSKVFWFDIDGLDNVYDDNSTNKDVIFEFSVKSSKGYSQPIKLRINMYKKEGSTSYWKTDFIK